MRLCVLTTTYPQRAGEPTGVFVEAIVRGARENGWRPVVVMPHAEGTPGREDRDGVEIRRFRFAWPRSLEALCFRGGMPAALQARPCLKVLLPGFFAAYWRKAMSAAADCDIIHCHWTVSGLIGVLTRRWRRLPVVVTTHGSDVSLASQAAGLRKLNRYVLRRADCMVIVGSHQRQPLLDMGCPPDKIEHIPYGVAQLFLDRPPAAKRDVDLLFVGRLAPEKRPDLLLEALALLGRRGVRFTAELVGDGPLRGQLQARLDGGTIPGVRLLGALPHAQVMDAMDRARCLALVSSREGLPNVVLEAMARGTAVLACDVGSVRDAVRDEVSGVLLPAELSAEALADAIGRVLADPGRMAVMGREARKAVEGRRWLEMNARYDKLFRRLIERQGESAERDRD